MKIVDSSKMDTVKKLEINVDDNELINKINLESSLMDADLNNVKAFLEGSGGTVLVTTKDYELKISKNSISTDVKVAFANSFIEMVGPEANFSEKVKLAQSFLHTVKEMQFSQFSSDGSDGESSISYS